MLGKPKGEKGLAMPKQQRFKTKYPGVFFIEVLGANGKPEKIFYAQYRRGGKLIEEKVGRQFTDDMTPARAAAIRADRIQGRELSNEDKRQEAKKEQWTIERLWLEYRAVNPGLKGSVTDENRFKNHLKPSVGGKEPSALTSLDVDRIRIRMLKTHKPATVRNTLELLRRIVNFGVKKQLCAGLNFAIQMPAVHNIKTEDLSPDELSRLLAVLDDESHTDAARLMKMALFTGMRRGELFKLRWESIDFERGFIHLLDPKGGPDQVIPLNPSARGVLDEIQKTESPFVFPGRSGAQRVDIKKAVNRLKELAGLPKDFRAIQGLRHCFASMLASSGEVGIYTLQRLMTHKSPAMTQRYAHLRDDALREASNLAGDLVERAAKERSTDGNAETA
jgi:integrase